MTTRFEYVFELGILPYLHYPELPALKETSEEINNCSIKEPLTFYGFKLPDSDDELFVQDLFNKNYTSLEERLQRNEDQRILSPYSSRNPQGQWIPSMYRATIYNKLWHNFTCMDLVYMLGDFIAYQLLKKYDRSTAHKIGGWDSTYVDDAIHLLETHGEHSKKNKLIALRPLYDQPN